MQPTEFPGCNTTYAKEQPENLPLPAYRAPDGLVITCWRLTWRERLAIALLGRFWLSIHTFNRPLQPLLPSVMPPAELEHEWLRAGVREAAETLGVPEP